MISKLNELDDIDFENIESVELELNEEIMTNFKIVFQKIFKTTSNWGFGAIIRQSREGGRTASKFLGCSKGYVDGIAIHIEEFKITIGKCRPIDCYDDTKITIPVKLIKNKCAETASKKQKDQNLGNVYEFEFSLMKALIENEMHEQGINVKTEGYSIQFEIPYTPRVFKSSLKRDLRIKHEIGDNFPVSLSFNGDSGYVTFKSISWSRAKKIIIALNP